MQSRAAVVILYSSSHPHKLNPILKHLRSQGSQSAGSPDLERDSDPSSHPAAFGRLASHRNCHGVTLCCDWIWEVAAWAAPLASAACPALDDIKHKLEQRPRPSATVGPCRLVRRVMAAVHSSTILRDTARARRQLRGNSPALAINGRFHASQSINTLDRTTTATAHSTQTVSRTDALG